ncbi:hypothetical protein [Vulcanisaeta distributa]|uniref:hypothetical protein n=1 Tax=Vulcanisaeta distributa TaxID=164451 RepID=UPI0006D24AF0|nr:hypothetical protein [Vulcanisaeta distributa]
MGSSDIRAYVEELNKQPIVLVDLEARNVTANRVEVVRFGRGVSRYIIENGLLGSWVTVKVRFNDGYEITFNGRLRKHEIRQGVYFVYVRYPPRLNVMLSKYHLQSVTAIIMIKPGMGGQRGGAKEDGGAGSGGVPNNEV